MAPRPIISTLLLVLIFLHSALAQIADSNLKQTFAQDGLKFAYPSDWTLTDKSTPETQHLMLSKTNSQILFVIVSPRETLLTSEQFWRIRNSVDQKFFTAIEKGLTGSEGTAIPENPCLDFNGRNIPGKRFKGSYREEPSIGEVYPFALGNRLLALVYLRAEKDEAAGDAVWKSLTESLFLTGSNKNAVGLNFKYDLVDKGPLNGRAVKLVRPDYPIAAGRISGTIKVATVINEEGNVVSAEAGPGNQYFRAYAAAAARQSKFNPTTICGKGVSVSGVITYEFKVDSPCDIGVPTKRC